MLKKWKRILKVSTAFLVLVVYLTAGFLNLERRKSNKQERDSTEASTWTPGGETLKTLVGYSLEYKIRQETKDRITCRERKRESKGKNWEWQYDPRLDIHVYSAYYDSRQDPYRYVRIIGILPRNSSFYCQMVYKDGRTVTQKADVQEIWSAKWGAGAGGGGEDGKGCRNYYPSLVGCFLPTEGDLAGKIPVRTSFVDEKCSGGAVNLSIRAGKKPKLKKKFAVCVKPVRFQGYNRRSLAEWIGLNRLLGAEKIIFYGNVTLDVLKFSGKKKRTETVKFESPPFRECGGNPYEESLWTKRKIEVITYNDCFYRNLYEAEFVIPLDLDEIIVPKSSENWQEAFLSHFGDQTPEYASFSVRNAYFFSDYPKKAVAYDSGNRSLKLVSSTRNNPEESIFRRKIRSFVLSPQTDSTKSFVKISKTLSVFNHYAFHVLGGAIRQYVFPEKVMQLNHYRNVCDPVLIDDCQRFLNYVTYDDTLEKFRNKLYHL